MTASLLKLEGVRLNVARRPSSMWGAQRGGAKGIVRRRGCFAHSKTIPGFAIMLLTEVIGLQGAKDSASGFRFGRARF
jgi:hypothetical protein